MNLINFILPLIFAGSLYFLAGPFLKKGKGQDSNEPENAKLADLLSKKEEILLGLKDLELDFKMEKISKSDYEHLYNEAFEEGREVLRNIERLQNAPQIPTPTQAQAPSQISSVNEAPRFCSQCGHKLVNAPKFCSQCGTRVGS